MDSNVSNEDQTPLTNNVLSQDPLAAGTPDVEEEPRHSQKSKGKGKAQVWSPWTTHRVEVLRFKPGFETFFVVENAERLDWAAGGQIQQSVWEYLNSCGDGEKTKVFTSDWPWESASLYQKNAGYELVKGNESKNEDQVNHCFQNMELTSTISLHECLRQIISVVDIKYSGLYKKPKPSRFIVFTDDESLLVPVNMESLHATLFVQGKTPIDPFEPNTLYTHLQIEFIIVGRQKIELLRFHPQDHDVVLEVPEPALSYLPPQPFNLNINLDPTAILNTLSTKLVDGKDLTSSLKIPTLQGLLKRVSVSGENKNGLNGPDGKEKIKMDKL